jgi:DNA mismatch repair ATPase MutL
MTGAAILKHRRWQEAKDVASITWEVKLSNKRKLTNQVERDLRLLLARTSHVQEATQDEEEEEEEEEEGDEEEEEEEESQDEEEEEEDYVTRGMLTKLRSRLC